MINALEIGLSWSGKAAGGADRVFADLAASLPEQGVRFVGVVAGPADLKTRTYGLIHSFAPEDSSTTTRLRGARVRITELLGSEKPDLLASHFALYTAPVLDKLSSQPFVMHFHGPWALESMEEGASSSSIFAKCKLERSIYRRADRIITLSSAFAKLLGKEYGIDEDKIRIVPGAVDLDRFQPACSRPHAREILGWPLQRPIVLSVRRLVNRMGLGHLIEGVAQMRKRVPEVLLCLGGNGPMRPILEQRVNELGVGDNVWFLGFISDENLPIAYRAADISVIPTSALEGFGLVAAESLAAGTAAMVTPVGGLPEVVEGLSTDLIFRSGRSEDLAEGLTAALRGEIHLPTPTECREYAERRFSRRLMASRVASVYRELVS
jgi:glycosyltransferase involved in cell wall biosynthesis